MGNHRCTWRVQRGLQGQYFTTPDLSGTPSTTRVDNDINFDWEQDPIPVPRNQGNFSAKWTGQFVPQISGDQVIKVCADGGVRVIVNGQILIDNFSKPPLPPLGYGPTPAFSAKFSAKPGPRTAWSWTTIVFRGFSATPMEVEQREDGTGVC